MKIHLGHAGWMSVDPTEAGNAELWAACLDKGKDDGIWFYMTPERAQRLYEELGKYLKEFGPKRKSKGR